MYPHFAPNIHTTQSVQRLKSTRKKTSSNKSTPNAIHFDANVFIISTRVDIDSLEKQIKSR